MANMKRLCLGVGLAIALSVPAAFADGPGTSNYVTPQPWGSANYRAGAPSDLIQRRQDAQTQQGPVSPLPPAYAGYAERLQGEQDRARAAIAAQPGTPSANPQQFFLFYGTMGARPR